MAQDGYFCFKAWFSSAPSSNFYNNKKKSHAPRQILSLGKHMKCMHFSDDMVFSFSLVIFQFISDENQDIYFLIPQKRKKRKSLALVIYLFFSDENQDIYFSWPNVHLIAPYAFS